MADDKLVQILLSGVPSWNEYSRGMRQTLGERWKPDLSYAKLNGLDLAKADLMFADLQGASLQSANLNGAELIQANLRGADLGKATLVDARLLQACLDDAKVFDANLRGAHLQQVTFRNAKLWFACFTSAFLVKANFEKAELCGAALDNANLLGATLKGADLSGARLTNANLSEARFEDANLAESDLTGANLSNSILSGANMQGCNGVLLDSSIVWRTRWDHKPTDAWNILRSKYTGAAFGVILFLTAAALTPRIANILFWGMWGRTGQSTLETGSALKVEFVTQLVEHAQDLDARGSDIDEASAKVLLEVARAIHDTSITVESKPAWKHMLGVGDGLSLASLLVGLLVAYNIVRGGLTLYLAPMREELENSGHTPPYRQYRWLMPFHFFVKWTGVFATVVFVLNFADWLLQPVFIP